MEKFLQGGIIDGSYEQPLFECCVGQELIFQNRTAEEIRIELSVEIPKVISFLKEFRKSKKLAPGWRDIEITI